MSNIPTLPGDDVFRKKREEYAASRLCERLNKKYERKTYHEKYKIIYWCEIVGSYVLNIISALTASVFMYFLIASLPLPMWVPALCAIAFVVIMELSTRKSAITFFEEWFQDGTINYAMAFVFLGLMSMNVSFSYYGVQQGILKFSSEAQTKDYEKDPRIIELDSTIAAKQATLDAYKNDDKFKTGGEILYNHNQFTIPALEQSIVSHSNERLAILSELNSENMGIKSDHKIETKDTSKKASILILVCSLLFILCIYGKEKHEFKTHSEFAGSTESKSAPEANSQAGAARSDTQKKVKTKREMPNAAPAGGKNIVLDVTKTKKDIRNHWTNANKPDPDPNDPYRESKLRTKAKNLDRYKEEKQTLEDLGYSVEELTNQSLSIEPKS